MMNEHDFDSQHLATETRRPLVLPSSTIRYRLGCGNLYVTVSYNEGKSYEVFAKLGRAGGCPCIMLEAIGKLCSTILRAGLGKDILIDRLGELKCPSQAWDEGRWILSCPDAIAKSLGEAEQ